MSSDKFNWRVKLSYMNPNVTDTSGVSMVVRLAVLQDPNAAERGAIVRLGCAANVVPVLAETMRPISYDSLNRPFLFDGGTAIAWVRYVKDAADGNDDDDDDAAACVNPLAVSAVQLLGERVFVSELADRLKPLYVEPVTVDAPNVYVAAVEHMGHVEFRRIQVTPGALAPANYSARNIKAFDHAVAETAAREPCGRLTVLTGPPGTGKTRWLEGLMAKTAGDFVLLPTSDVAGLTSPTLTRALLRLRSDIDDGQPLNLIIEDADSAIVERFEGNAGAIAVILNASDGILGRALDLRLFVTTNAASVTLDPAILRPGRLCQHVVFEPLPKDVALRLAASLERRAPTPVPASMTLAEVYALPRLNDAS